MYHNMPAYNNITTIAAATVADWRAWLRRHGQKQKSVWLVLYKKESDMASIDYSTAVDEALCWGWVDSKINKRDAASWYQYFAQRSAKSNWSRVNKEKIALLEKEGRIQPAGWAVIEAAKKSGTWTALDAVEKGIIPNDLQTAFTKNKKAAGYFDAFPRSVKRAILEWINTAKKEETRAARIAKTVAMAAENKRANYPQ